jgi:hypothetical protein
VGAGTHPGLRGALPPPACPPAWKRRGQAGARLACMVWVVLRGVVGGGGKGACLPRARVRRGVHGRRECRGRQRTTPHPLAHPTSDSPNFT